MFMCLKFTFYYAINFSAHILDFISRTSNMNNEEFEVHDLYDVDDLQNVFWTGQQILRSRLYEYDIQKKFLEEIKDS